MRGHVVAMSGELDVTVLFLWFAFARNQTASQSTPASTVLEPQGIMFTALSYGMSLLVVAWAIYRISGGLFNPAVSSRLPNGRQMLTY
jgi:aquaporin related protein